ncbi:MAG: anti-sigma factor antagonist [Hormoscilla sp. GM7CHS1pb]|nr:anti-sigma factor antagonist [Hormoscilla sp. GM7CHS1pb]
MVLDTIKKTGFDRSVYIIDEYDGEQSTINEQEISSFQANLETTSSGIAKITLSGELDGATAPAFKAKVEAAAAAKPQRLVLLMQDLEYMASAGLRVLIFSKQKMGTSVDIYLVGVQEMVLDTIKKTGFDRSVYIIDEYDAEQIENL